MKKYMVSLTSLFLLIILLTGCQQPIKDYKKKINTVGIPKALNEMEMLSSECTQRLNDIILDSSQQFSDFDQKLEFLGYEDLESSISNFKELVQKNLANCEKLKIKDQNMSRIHQMLLNVLLKYKEEVYYLEEVAKANKDILEMHFDVQKINDQILEVTFSGKPTSIEYKTALEEFVETNYQLLKLFDNEHAKSVLNGASLDESLLIHSVEEARQAIEDLKTIQTINPTDVEIHNLLIQMYERILDMYDYTLNHKEVIEWSNKYNSFSDYAEVQKQSITKDIKEWEEAIDILE